MATIADAPAEHRRLAERMPADIRARMDPAELRLRLAEVARLNDQIGSMPDASTARGLSTHAEAMLKALPFAELEEQCRQLADSARNAAAPADSGGFLAAAAKLKQDNPQPQAMTQAARLADTQHGLGHLAASDDATHRQLATAAQMIRVQRAAIMQGKPPGAASTRRSGPARGRRESADVTKAGDVEVVPVLNKAAGAATRRLITKAALQAEVTKAVTAASAAAGLDERLDEVAAEIHATRAEMSGRISTMGAPITKTKMRSQ